MRGRNLNSAAYRSNLKGVLERALWSEAPVGEESKAERRRAAPLRVFFLLVGGVGRQEAAMSVVAELRNDKKINRHGAALYLIRLELKPGS